MSQPVIKCSGTFFEPADNADSLEFFQFCFRLMQNPERATCEFGVKGPNDTLFMVRQGETPSEANQRFWTEQEKVLANLAKAVLSSDETEHSEEVKFLDGGTHLRVYVNGRIDIIKKGSSWEGCVAGVVAALQTVRKHREEKGQGQS